MKKRYLYSLLFGIPGLFIALIAAFVIFGGAAGILWIFVYGDNPWPSSAENILSILFAAVFLLAWVACITVGYITGKKLEIDPVLNRNHILVSGGLTMLFILFIVLQQWRVGNLGPKTDGELCSEYCSSQGYAASGTPFENSGDRICTCFDNSGNEALKVPLNDILK
jgi:hypothetical protein